MAGRPAAERATPPRPPIRAAWRRTPRSVCAASGGEGAQRGDRVVGQVAGPEQVPQRPWSAPGRRSTRPRRRADGRSSRRRPTAPRARARAARLSSSSPRSGKREVRRVGGVQADPAVGAGQRPGAGPDHLAGRRELVEHGRLVAEHAAGRARTARAPRRARRSRRAARRRTARPRPRAAGCRRPARPAGTARALPARRARPRGGPRPANGGGSVAAPRRHTTRRRGRRAGTRPRRPDRTPASRFSASCATARPSAKRLATSAVVNGPWRAGEPADQVAERVGRPGR